MCCSMGVYGCGVGHFVPTESAGRWWFTFGETIQNISRLWNGVDCHREKETAAFRVAR